MKPPPFEYVVPSSVEEAIAVLSQHDGDAKVLAGGQSLVPLLAMRFARPTALVDLAKVPGLDYIREQDGSIAIGAMATQRAAELSDVVRERQPLVQYASRFIAHPQIRNRGTVGGSVAHGDPAGIWPAVMVAVDGDVTLTGPNGARTVTSADFFVTYLTTALEPSEVLTEVRLPVMPAGTGWSFIELARRHGDFALAGVVVTMALDGGACAAPRVVLYGVGATPIRVPEVEQMLTGERPSEHLFAQAGAEASRAIEEPTADVHGSSEYRRHLAGVLTRRGLTEAAARAAA